MRTTFLGGAYVYESAVFELDFSGRHWWVGGLVRGQGENVRKREGEGRRVPASNTSEQPGLDRVGKEQPGFDRGAGLSC